jgi:MinD-like ATPase involved in chromosome partitioning or flagellar assembly
MMHVSTFYSFKGGVGRTLLLVNAGAALARSRRKVLLWDLDLEAPGMHHIAGLKPKRPVASGFLEWVLEWQKTDFAPVEGHLLESFLGLPYEVPGLPGLFVLPAFGARASFSSLYQRIQWHTFTVDRPEVGRTLFETLLDGLAEHQGYEHVLIDSRTGITDLGGLITALLPHTTVLVGNYSAQNTVGLLSIYRALQAAVAGKLSERRYGRLQRLLVASPVPLHESKQSLEERRSLWNNEFKSPPTETRVEIPFVARLLFGEELLVETDPQSPTAKAYQDVARRLTEMREERILQEESTEVGSLLYRDLAQTSLGIGAPQARKRGVSFTEQVERLLQLLGYTVNRNSEADEAWVFVAQRKSGFLQERYLVTCKEARQPLSQKQAADLLSWMREASQTVPGTTPMLVASAFSTAALESLREQNLLALTLADLERELFDFKPYLARLRRSYEETTLARTYVPPRLVPRPPEEKGAEVLERALAWARGEGAPLWLVVGENGTGKTSFIRRFAYELATAAEKDERMPAPLLLHLKDFSALSSLESLLQEHLASSIGWRGDPSVLLHLLSAGRLVLLLDGLDEMGAVESSPTMLEEQFRQLTRPAGLATGMAQGNRILITARPEYFRRQARAGKGPEATKHPQEPLLGRIAVGLGAEVDELAQWDGPQLREFLLRAAGPERTSRWEPLLAEIVRRPELLSRPLFVELLLQAVPEPSTGAETLNLGSLFERFTTRWLQQLSAWPVPPERWNRFFERLARELRGHPQGKLYQHQFLVLLMEAVDERQATLDLGRLELALRASPFLTRSPDGYYQFTFKLFEEFFYAKHLLRAALEEKLAEALDTAPPTPDCASFLVDLIAHEEERAPFRQAVSDVLVQAYRQRSTENALRLAYEWACRVAGKAGRESQKEMALFLPKEASLTGADLRGKQWAFAWFQGAALTGARLDGSDLTEANFQGIDGLALSAQGCVLDGTNFESATLFGANFSGSTATRHAPIFTHADLMEAVLPDFSTAEQPKTSHDTKG